MKIGAILLVFFVPLPGCAAVPEGFEPELGRYLVRAAWQFSAISLGRAWGPLRGDQNACYRAQGLATMSMPRCQS